MENLKQKVLQRIDSMQDEAIGFLADLVKAESINPPGDTRPVMAVIENKLKEFGQSYEIVKAREDMPNILVSFNEGARPQLLYNGHIDTVPIGEESAWEVDPLGAVIQDGVMIGRGVADMKGGVGAMLMAAKALSLEQVPLKGSLVLNFVSDEETGGDNGVGYLMKHDYLSPDMVVVGEITNRNSIAISEKGVAVFSLTTRGRTAHASTPWAGINAIEKMVKILHTLQVQLIDRFDERPSGVLPPASMNVGTIQGGISFNVVADSCNVLLDRRTLPGETAKSARDEILEVISTLQQEDPDINASLDLLGSGDPFETLPDTEICRIARRTMVELDLNPDCVGYEQVSDGRYFAEKGIPTILIGPGIAQQAHTPNEQLELDQYLEAINIYAVLAINTLC